MNARDDKTKQHLSRVDELLLTIEKCETYLDSAFDTEELLTRPSVIPPPPKASTTVSTKTPDSPSESPLELVVHFENTEQMTEIVAQRIRAARLDRGWRQKDLADACSMARPNIARLESGRRMPSISTLGRLASALEIPFGKLIKPE
jgi:ribosome-binding protein aMBF1 (putative translation factor)